MNITQALLRFVFAAALALGSARAQTTISALPAASVVGANNLTIVVDTTNPTLSLQTQKATVSQLINGLPAATTSTPGILSAADKTLLANATASPSASTLVARDASGNSAFNSVTLSGGTISGSPILPIDIPNKAYVDAIAVGLAVKSPAVAATTPALGNVTLTAGAPTVVDGVTLILGNRVLVKDQTDNKQNGIYSVTTLGTGANGTWTRSTDADTGAELVSGCYIFISGGTVNANGAFVMVTPGAITIGTSPIVWSLYSQITNILANNIIGQIIAAQIADANITTTKFASGIEPVSIVSSLPSPSGYTGPNAVFNTSDKKLYRYNGTAFVASVAATDVTGQITTTQITDGAISTPKLAAGSVTASQIAANTITASQIAADTITAGQIATGAISTSELAASAVTAAKIAAGTITTTQIAAGTILASNIAAGTITADRLAVSTLSAISANLGTVTAGTITGVSITTTTGNIGGFTIGTNDLHAGSGANGVYIVNSAPPYIRVGNQSGGPTSYIQQDGIQVRSTSALGQVLIGSTNYGDRSIELQNSSGTSNIGLRGDNGVISSIQLTASGLVTAGSITSNGSITLTSGNIALPSSTALNHILFATTVQTFSSGATEQSFTVSTPAYMISGYCNCSSDGNLIGRYYWDGSSSSTAVFKVRRIDGASFTGTYRFSYAVLN